MPIIVPPSSSLDGKKGAWKGDDDLLQHTWPGYWFAFHPLIRRAPHPVALPLTPMPPLKTWIHATPLSLSSIVYCVCRSTISTILQIDTPSLFISHVPHQHPVTLTPVTLWCPRHLPISHLLHKYSILIILGCFCIPALSAHVQQ